MEQKQILFKLKGMQRDLSNSTFRSEYAFENMNLRITADTDNGLLSVTNEKGTKQLIVSEGYGDLIFNKIYFEGNKVKATYPVGSEVRIVCTTEGGSSEIQIKEGETWAWSYNGSNVTQINILTRRDSTYFYGTSFMESLSIYTLGYIIGVAEINNKAVIFHFREYSYESCITLLSLEDYEGTQFIKATPLYIGQTGMNDLNFSTEHPIETLVDIENENIQKVYWVDGVNQPRVINIAGEIKKDNPNQFDFVPEITGGEIEVEHSETPGQFPAGVIQYAFTYFNKYGQESAVVDISPIYYIANEDSGAEPGTIVNKSFNITFDNLDTNWEYIRLYSIIRTSLNTTPEVKKVTDLKLTDVINYIDTGVSGEYIATTDLLYKGGEVLHASTIASKDGTLFLGKIKLHSDNIINKDEIENLKDNISIVPFYKYNSKEDKENIPSYNGEYNSEENVGKYYQYTNFIGRTSTNIKHFKTNETYRLGITLQDKYGKWCDPIWVGDYKITTYPIYFKYSTRIDNFIGLLKTQDDVYKALNEAFAVNYDFYVVPYNIRVPILEGTSIKTTLITEPTALKRDYVYRNNLYRVTNTKGDELGYSAVYDSELRNNAGLRASIYTTEGLVKENSYIEYSSFYGNLILYTENSYEFVFIEDEVTIQKEVRVPYYRGTQEKIIGAGTIIEIPKLTLNEESKNIINKATKVKPLVVYPDEVHREVICQGVLCPTVFNVEDRANNSPFVQSSWNFRFNPPTIIDVDNDPTDNTSRKKSGTWSEYKHLAFIEGLGLDSVFNENGEFNSVFKYFPSYDSPLKDSYNNKTERENFISKCNNRYIVDRSYLTFHSADIEFNTNINVENKKLRIVGIVPITSTNSDISINGLTYNPDLDLPDYIRISPGFNKVKIHSFNKSVYAYRKLLNGAFWRDICPIELTLYPRDFYISYWNPSSIVYSSNVKLSKSRIGNYSFSNYNIYNSYLTDVNTEITALNLDNEYYFKNLSNGNFYKGTNIDKVITNNQKNIVLSYSSDFKYRISLSGGQVYYTLKPYDLYQEEDEIELYDDSNTLITIGKYVSSNSIMIDNSLYNITALSGIGNIDKSNNSSLINTGKIYNLSKENQRLEVINITYKSGTHAIIGLGTNYLSVGKSTLDKSVTGFPFWKELDTPITFNPVGPEVLTKYGFLYLGELYQEVPEEIKFGGTSEYALQNNLWLPAGKAVNIGKEIIWTEGDTYYQRYDCVKTLPRNDSDLNGVTDVLSFMCETRVNLDGRYDDRYKFVEDPLLITSDNINKLNEVYNQPDNFFNYRILDSERFNINNFPNTIVWSKTKQANNIVDNWTNINLVSSLDLDGNKGSLNAIKLFNDNILAFQDKGISQILFNSRVQLNTSDGVPIEISNSGKVDGKRYLTTNIGCLNKYSICDSPNGIYFIDDYNKSLYLFNGQFRNISEEKGFHSWFRNKSNLNVWDPINFNNAVIYRDPINNEILIIYKDTCLVFSEVLGEFSSFYSYENTPYMSILNGENILFNNKGVWVKNAGDYNSFFGDYKDFYTTIIANDNPTYDKIFSTLDFRADMLNSGNKIINSIPIAPFNYLKVTNEYQEVESNLSGRALIPKFRVWRAQIPRVGKDRIRNTWATITLGNKVNNRKGINEKVRLHDIVVNYFI